MSGDCNVCINGKLPSYSPTCVECGLSRKNYKPITNYDRLVSKSPEELADWLAEVLFHCSNTICDERCPMYECCCGQPSDNIEDWLKQEGET
jgi:hypothetical protein